MTRIVIELEDQLAEQWNALSRGVDDKTTLFSEFINYHQKNARREIAELQTDLDHYERIYQMSSDEFFRKFEQGELEDTKDFILWGGIYEMQQDSKDKLAKLS